MKTPWNMLVAFFILVLTAATASLFMITGVDAGQMSGRPISIAAHAAAQGTPSSNQPVGSMIGEIKGTIAATVAKADDPKGLTMRSEPSLSGSSVAFLAPGTTVKGPTTYKNGWVKVDAPPYHGWVNVAFLQALGGLAAILSVDRPENCLRIRSGPSTSYAVVECAHRGDKLVVTGFWSDSNWALLQDKGWVYGPQINAASKPVRSVSATPRISRVRSAVWDDDSSVEEFVPSYDYSYNYYEPYWSLWPGSFYWLGGHSRHRHFTDHRVYSGYRASSFGHRGGGRRR